MGDIWTEIKFIRENPFIPITELATDDYTPTTNNGHILKLNGGHIKNNFIARPIIQVQTIYFHYTTI